MSEQIQLEEAALAWAQRKRVEATHADSNKWLPVDPVGQCLQDHYSPSVFTDPEYRFRLAPEPPANKFRAWKLDEVPVGAQIRAIGLRWRGLILSVSANGEIHCMTGFIPTEYALHNHEHSIDGGKTWHPCGVEVVR